MDSNQYARDRDAFQEHVRSMLPDIQSDDIEDFVQDCLVRLMLADRRVGILDRATFREVLVRRQAASYISRRIAETRLARELALEHVAFDEEAPSVALNRMRPLVDRYRPRTSSQESLNARSSLIAPRETTDVDPLGIAIQIVRFFVRDPEHRADCVTCLLEEFESQASTRPRTLAALIVFFDAVNIAWSHLVSDRLRTWVSRHRSG